MIVGETEKGKAQVVVGQQRSEEDGGAPIPRSVDGGKNEGEHTHGKENRKKL